MTTTTPPFPPNAAPAGASQPQPQPPHPPKRDDRTLRTVLLAAGSTLIAAVIAVGVVQFAVAGTGEDQSGVYRVSDTIGTLDIDSSAADVTVRYGDVDETEIDFDSADRPLRFDHRMRGDTLVVEVKNRGWWLFGFGGGGFGSARLDIVLPEALAPVGLEVDSSAGSVDLAGDFGAVELDSSAGRVDLAGSAASLDAETSAGEVTALDLEVTGAVQVETSAGEVTLSFANLPRAMRVETSAGSMRVALPEGSYDLRTETSAGSVDNALPSDPRSDRVYTFEASAGSITLEPR